MKKIITLIAIITGISAHSQYIKHQRILVDVTAGYSIAASLKLDEKNLNFESTNLSGVLFDASAYYRLGFNSLHMVGIRGSYVDAKNTFESVMFDDFFPSEIDKKYNSFFIGPSYMVNYVSFNGKFSSSGALTPGYTQINSVISDSNSEARVKASGYGISFSGTSSRRLFESFDWILKLGINYSKYSSFSTSYSGPKEIVIAENNKFDLIRVEISTGFSYKF